MAFGVSKNARQVSGNRAPSTPPSGSRGQPSVWIDKQICIPYTVYNRLYERPSMKIRVHRPLREEVYDAVRRAIVQGELSPGNRVVETELAGGRALLPGHVRQEPF